MIRLAHDNTKPVLSIGDDGNGFDPEKRLKETQKEKRLGLRGMEERVRLLNGQMEIQSKPGKGAKVRVEIPFER